MNLFLLRLRMLCAMFVDNFQKGSEEENFEVFQIYYFLPLKNITALYLYKSDFSLRDDALR